MILPRQVADSCLWPLLRHTHVGWVQPEGEVSGAHAELRRDTVMGAA